MPQKRRGRLQRSRRRPADVFLNIPYDQKFQKLYIAYIAGLSAFGLVPRATLEIRSSTRRLDRILALLKACPYAIHDLSRVELDVRPPRTPRFNMPFELGLSVAWGKFGSGSHAWFVYEAKSRRISKSLSDLNGTDVYIHGRRIDGVFRELCNTFVRSGRQPSVQQMWRIYREVRSSLPTILRAAGARSAFGARVFKEICVVASASADRNVGQAQWP
jgi:hypothetical protein